MASPTHLWLLDNAFRDAAASISKLRMANPGGEIPKRDLDRIANEVAHTIVTKLKLAAWEFGGTLEDQIRDTLNVLDKLIQTEFDKKSKENPDKTPEEVYKSVVDIIERGGFIDNLLSQGKGSPLEAHIPELEEHLSAISNMELVKQKLAKEAIKAPISKLHGDTQPAKASAFKRLGGEKAGIAAGYVATRETDAGKSETFMVKSAEKAPHLDDRGFDTRNNDSYDTMSFFNEFVTSGLYRRMLYERAPVIAGVEASAEGQVLLRSKFLNEFSTVTEYTGGEPPFPFGEKHLDKPKGAIVGVSGAGKLMAALLAGGEQDMHAGNIGVMTESDGRRVYSKIDHGRSATMLFTKGESMWQGCWSACQNYGYGIKIPINVTEFRESLDQILTMTPDEIEKHIKARIHELRKTGFDPKGLEFMMWTDTVDRSMGRDGPTVPPTYEKYDSLDQLEKSYIERFSNHWKALAQYRELVVAAEKMYNPKRPGQDAMDGWDAGKWITYMKGINPIVFALKYGWKIDLSKEEPYKSHPEMNPLMEPLEYALKHNINVDGKSPIEYAMLEGIKIEGQDPTIYASMNDLTINGKDPIEYAVEKGIQVNGESPLVFAIAMDTEIDGKSPIQYAVLKGIQIEGQDPTIYASMNDLKINGQDPTIYASMNNLKINGLDPIMYGSMNNLMIDGKDPIAYAVEKGIKIDGKPALVMAVFFDIEVEIDGKDALSKLVEEYHKEPSKLEDQKPVIREALGGLDPLQYAISEGKKINGHNPVDYALNNRIRLQGNTNPILYAFKEGKEPMPIKDFVGHYKKYCGDPANKNTFFNDIKGDKATGKKIFDALCEKSRETNVKGGMTQVEFFANKKEINAIKNDFKIEGKFKEPPGQSR